MLAPNKIMDAVGGVLGERFPEEPIYRNITPVGFQRPSNLIAYGPQKFLDATATTLDIEATVTITTFAETDDNGNCSTEELLRRMSAVQELFAVEGVRVGEERRVLRVIKNDGTCNSDYAEIAVTLQFRDDRPVSGKDWPLMREVDVKMRVE